MEVLDGLYATDMLRLFEGFPLDGESALNGAPSGGSSTDNSWLSCPSSGWGPISQEYYDITPCFLQGILFGLSGLFMLFIGGYQVEVLRNKKVTRGNRFSWSFYAKLLLVLIYSFFQVALFFNYSSSKNIIGLALVINIPATLVALSMHYVEQFKASIPNGVLLFYWLFQIVFHSGRVINLMLRQGIRSHFAIITIVSVVNAFLILLLELVFPIVPLTPFEESLRTSPYERANVFSRITFRWMNGLMKKGYDHYLQETDLPFLPASLTAANTSKRFYQFWNTQLKRISLLFTIAKAFGLPFFIGGIFKCLQDLLAFTQPQLLRLLINFVNEYSKSLKEGKPLPLTKGLFLAFGMFVVSVVQTACLHQYFQRAFDLGMRIKTSMTSVIYNKSLVLSNDSKQQSTMGDIVNLMSVDVQRLQDLVQNLQLLWSGPFQIILCLASLYNLVGKSMLIGIVVMLIMIPVNSSLARYQKKLQKTQMKYKDERTRLTSEILNNIKSLKLYAWEIPYLNNLTHVRNDKELANLKRIGIFSAVQTFSFILSPFLVSCSTFACFVLFGGGRTLLTDIVFPALALFNLLSFPLAVIPFVISNIIEAQVAVKRLVHFLASPELQKDAVMKAPRADNLGDISVSIKNATFLWSKNKKDENLKVALAGVNFRSAKGDLDCIVGKVGSGKSSLLQAILGDLYRLDGEVILHGKVAYVTQVPWIMNATFKDNILFGHKYDPEFYQHVLKACALTIDLDILPKGDKTIVGEKGISLSGGQKARLALARAVYARADVYLLDDPLSAVDEHVGKHLVDRVLGPRGLLKTKCRILATNNLQVLTVANNIHLVSGGRLIEQGQYERIVEQKSSQLYQLINEFGRKNRTDENQEEALNEFIDGEQSTDADTKKKINYDSESDSGSLRRASDAPFVVEENADKDEADIDNIEKSKEHLERGKVKWDVYLLYAKSCNPRYVVLFMIVVVAGMSTNVLASVWLKHWSEVNSNYGYNPNLFKYLGVYFLLGIVTSLIVFGQSCIMWLYCTIHGSNILHKRMTQSVLRAPMSFFETTPTGRILNRFSNDIYKVDEVLSRVFTMLFSNSVKVFLTIVVISFSTWQFIGIIIPLTVLYMYYQQYYLKTSRELKRLESISRSPIFANFQETLSGVSVIRAYGQERRFQCLNEYLVDKNMTAFHPSINANRWLAVRLEFLGSLIVLSAAGLAIITLKTSGISAGLIGLSISYALQVTQSLNWIVRMSVEVESNIVSVERILEYSTLESEAAEIVPDHRPPQKWPEHGEVHFRNYSTKYRPELDFVLKDINLAMKSKEKIGIVGRTGAGKSSLTLALFRIIESYGGDITIDDINIGSIGIADLRHKLSIIPQDAQVFGGTIRSNLDPTNVFSDEQMWRALEHSHLKDHVLSIYHSRDSESNIETPLDVQIHEGGSNLSVGQRQLMCLARALLIPSHVLVLDEATAAVDVETDKLLQKTIRSEFKDRTIITIAHRINTILDSDKIVVLDKGRVVEFDAPAKLLQNESSWFHSLSKQAGII